MPKKDHDSGLSDFGRFSEPALLILISLADGRAPVHHRRTHSPRPGLDITPRSDAVTPGTPLGRDLASITRVKTAATVDRGGDGAQR